MTIRSHRWVRIHGALAGAVLALAGCTQPVATAIPTSSAAPVQAAPAAKASFGARVVLKKGRAATYPDGLNIVLDKVDDSRCPKGVQCVWSGELGPQLTVSGGEVGKKLFVLLATVTHPKVMLGVYAFALVDADVDSATVVVTKTAGSAKF